MGYKKPIKVSAPEYVDLLMTWVEDQINNEQIFPMEESNKFPKNFKTIVKTIFKRLFRVYGHIYHSHIQKYVQLDAEAHLNSCFKHFYYFIARVVANDGTVRKEDKVLAINVKPGWKSGTKITFQREGDQAPNKIPADIVFIIRGKPHPNFKREGSDLKYACQISLKEALCGSQVSVPLLGGERLALNLQDEVIKPSTVKRVVGKGLPNPKDPARRGDLIVNFDIVFPERLSTATRDLFRSHLPGK